VLRRATKALMPLRLAIANLRSDGRGEIFSLWTFLSIAAPLAVSEVHFQHAIQARAQLHHSTARSNWRATHSKYEEACTVLADDL
jgi:hypothetical protein